MLIFTFTSDLDREFKSCYYILPLMIQKIETSLMHVVDKKRVLWWRISLPADCFYRECLLVVGRGSWVRRRGSWVPSRGSWVPSRGSWVPSRGSWVPSRGSWKGSAYTTNSNVYSSIAVFNFKFQLWLKSTTIESYLVLRSTVLFNGHSSPWFLLRCLCVPDGLTVVCETKWNETKWKSVVCELKICSLRYGNL